ncbi:C2 family cysteine protease [Legionella spiritensis]|uniref:Coiled-coil protein n=1 Tax=Legionella spiritensis TaxID=452 RepID=A0A0W0Z9E6_LEGSP|nr:C2 family cysteine protease [Legionella spiritensis]KTD65724.1 coiled-coil protein [Legionella spiritensis]SNV43263.1 coiled-coil protein [Legionella spiritensis]
MSVPELPITADHLKQREVRVFPGVRGKVKHPIRINDSVIIPEGQPVIIQPLNADRQSETPRFKITLFERDSSAAASNLPESQRDIIPGISYDQVEILHPQKSFLFEEHYQRSNERLFPNPDSSPSLTEINQSRIPNCFLLASMQAILNHPNGAHFIRGMMKQHDDGSTTVRLFNPETLKPEYIRVNTAMLVDEKGLPLNSHKAMWVHVLETAYVALGKRMNKDVDSSASSVFSKGGQMSWATTILTGLKEERRLNMTQGEQFWLIKDSERGQIEPLLDLPLESFPQKDKIFKGVLELQLKEIVAMQAFAGTPEEALEKAYQDYMAYFQFYLENRVACETILRGEGSIGDKLLHIVDLISDGFETKYPDLGKFLVECINFYNVPVADKTVRGEVSAFSGFYTVKQNEHFNAMRDALANGQLVTAATPEKFTVPVPGLRNNHAYTVLDVFSREEKATHPVTMVETVREVRYVRLRNPWGSTGRTYLQEEGTMAFTPVEDANADIFEIELSDFYNNYSYVSISRFANETFAYDERRSQLLKSIEKIRSGFRVYTDSTLDDLSRFNNQYGQYEQQFLDLEKLHLQVISPELLIGFENIFKENLDRKIEEKMVRALLEINEIVIPFYAGDKKHEYHHLYHILKLQWLEKQDSPDNETIRSLRQDIVQNAGYDFCPFMNNEKLKLDILVRAYARDYMEDLFHTRRLIQQLENQLRILDPDNLEGIFLNGTLLKQQCVRILTMKAALAELDINLDEAELIELQDKINELNNLLKEQPAYDQFKDKYKSEINTLLDLAVNSYQDGHISDKELKHLQQVATHLNIRELTDTAREFQDSDNVHRQQIGKQLGVLAGLRQALHHLVSKIREAWTGFINKFLSDKPANSYELPARQTKYPVFFAPQETQKPDLRDAESLPTHTAAACA